MANTDQRRQTHRQFGLFLIIGGVNTLFGYSIFSLMIYLGLNYVLASLITTCIGILFNFNTTGRLVFKNKSYDVFLRFIAVYAFTFLTGISMIKLGTYIYPNLYVLGGISTLINAIIAFLLHKYFVFHRIQHEAHS